MPSVTNRNVVPASISIGAPNMLRPSIQAPMFSNPRPARCGYTSVKDGTATREQAVLGGGYEPATTGVGARDAHGSAVYGAIGGLEADLWGGGRGRPADRAPARRGECARCDPKNPTECAREM